MLNKKESLSETENYYNKENCFICSYKKARHMVGRLIRDTIPDLYHRILFKKNGLKYLSEVTEALNDGGVTAFATFGSLLGLIREGGILKHDRDIDIGVIYESSETYAAIETIFENMGFCRTHEFSVNGEAKERSYTKRHIKIDIHYYLKDEDTKLMFCWLFYGPIPDTCNREWYSVIKECPRVSKLRILRSGRHRIYVPENAEELLEYKYGKNWRIPDKGWSYWEGPNTVKMDEIGVFDGTAFGTDV